MSSIRCSNCNLTNWVQAVTCKRCGFALSAPSFSYQQSSAQPAYPETSTDNAYGGVGHESNSYSRSPNPSPYQGYAPENQLKTGLAIASMILGIICIPSALLLIGILIAPIALILGIVALVKVNKEPRVYGGKGFAIAGIATSAAALVFIVPLIAAIAVPNVLAAKRAADEGSTISSLRTMHSAESTYQATLGAGFFGDLNQLSKGALIDSELASGVKKAYRYEVVVSSSGRGFEAYATPVSKAGGARSFMICEDGVIRGANKKGQRAEKTDPPISIGR